MYTRQTYRSTPCRQRYCFQPSWQARPGGIRPREFCDPEYSYRFVCHLDMCVEHARQLLKEIDVQAGPSAIEVQWALSEVLLQRRLLAYPVTPLRSSDPRLRARTIRIENTDYQINHPSVRMVREAQSKSFQTVGQARLFLDHFQLDKAALCALIIEGDWKRNPQHREEAELRQILAEQFLAGEMVITQAPAPVPPKPEPEPEAPPYDIGNRKASLGPHAGLHNQDWEGVEVKQDSFKTVKSVEMDDLAEDEKIAARIFKNQGWEGEKIEEILSSGGDFATQELKPGDNLYGFTSQGRGKDIGKSAYWLDEASFKDVERKFYKNGSWDKEGVKGYLALPCYNRANAINTVAITQPTTGVSSSIGRATELIKYTDKSGYTTGTLGKIMGGGGTQVTVVPTALKRLPG